MTFGDSGSFEISPYGHGPLHFLGNMGQKGILSVPQNENRIVRPRSSGRPADSGGAFWHQLTLRAMLSAWNSFLPELVQVT